MLKKIKSLSSNQIFCITFCLLLSLFAVSRIFYAVFMKLDIYNETICETHFAADDFDAIQIEYINSLQVVTDGDDSQLIMNTLPCKVKNVWVDMQFSVDPGEIVLFYKTNETQDWSSSRVIYAELRDGYYYFNLSTVQATALRLDLGIFPSVTVTFHDIIYNHRFTFAEFFALTSVNIFWVILLSCFIAAFASFLWAILNHISTHKKNIPSTP